MSVSPEMIIRVNPFVLNLRSIHGELSPSVTQGFHRYAAKNQGVLSPLGVRAEDSVLEEAYDRVPLVELDRPGYFIRAEAQRSFLLTAEDLGRLANNDVARAKQDPGMGTLRRVGLVAVTGTREDLARVRPIHDVLTIVDGGGSDEEKPPILAARARQPDFLGRSGVDTYLSLFVISLGCGLQVPEKRRSLDPSPEDNRLIDYWFTADSRPQEKILGSPEAHFGVVPIGPTVPDIGRTRPPLRQLVGVSA